MNPTSTEPRAGAEGEMRVAPMFRRQGAWLCDTAIEAVIIVVSAVAGYILSWIGLGAIGDHGMAIFAFAIIGAVFIAIGALLLWWIVLFVIVALSGQTLGQKLAKVRVVDRNGAKLNLWRALLRFVLGRSAIASPVIALFVADGYVVLVIWIVLIAVLYAPILFDDANRGLADRLVGSYVVPVRDADA